MTAYAQSRTPHQLVRMADGDTLLERLELADTFWSRLVGLQFRRELSPDAGLLLRPCSSLHTGFMRFPIDVLMLDAELRVVCIRRDLRPWRLLFCARGTRAVLETVPGAVDARVGEQLAVRRVRGEKMGGG